MFGKLGFVHTEPKALEDALATAQRDFAERTGLACNFSPAGFGYVRLFKGKELESFVHFILLCADKYEGELITKSRHGENIWIKQPDFSADNMIPSMSDLANLLESSSRPFYADLRYPTTTAR